MMNTSSIIKKTMMFLSLTFAGNVLMAQTADVKTADKWVKSRVWAKELNVKVNKDVNSVEFEKQYTANPALWQKAFDFLNNKAKLDTIAPGKYLIDGDNVFAIITNNPSKTMDVAKYESHRNYIDLQYVVKGKEQIGVAPVAAATVTVPYDPAKDNANYTADGKFYLATPAEFFLFFPADAHKPNVKADGFDVVKKLVIKIKYAQ